MQEQFGYAYGKAWNLNYRTNNSLLETFAVNSLNELSSISRSSLLTVAGTSTGPATIVNVSGTGIFVGLKPVLESFDGVSTRGLADFFERMTHALARVSVGFDLYGSSQKRVTLPRFAADTPVMGIGFLGPEGALFAGSY